MHKTASGGISSPNPSSKKASNLETALRIAPSHDVAGSLSEIKAHNFERREPLQDQNR